MDEPQYPVDYPCPKCGFVSPFVPRADTPHFGEIRCPVHGHSWIRRPREDGKPKRKANTALIGSLNSMTQDFCWLCSRHKDLLASLKPATRLEVHHIVPVAEGGSDEPHNLILLCTECHAEAHRRREAFERYRALLNCSVHE